MNILFSKNPNLKLFFSGAGGGGGGVRVSDFFFLQRILIKTRKSVHRTQMPRQMPFRKRVYM